MGLFNMRTTAKMADRIHRGKTQKQVSKLLEQEIAMADVAIEDAVRAAVQAARCWRKVRATLMAQQLLARRAKQMRRVRRAK